RRPLRAAADHRVPQARDRLRGRPQGRARQAGRDRLRVQLRHQSALPERRGDPPVQSGRRPMIPYGRQDIDEADIAAVVEVLRSDWLTTGPTIERFEESVRRRVGAAHAVACANGTVALHLACRALGLGPGDTLWTSPNTFVASAN